MITVGSISNPEVAWDHRTSTEETRFTRNILPLQVTTNKRNSHPALAPSRPAAASASALVRDAVARLPRGEGARQEVEDLVRQSRFLSESPEAARAGVLANLVSGALDRLQAEQPDPCVKFDSARRLWVYLHRGRTEEQAWIFGLIMSQKL